MRLAACQTPDVCGDIEQALALIELNTADAWARGARLVCFPEAFLQGYVVDDAHVDRLAISLSSPEFAKVLERLAHLEPLVVFGLFERDAGDLYNSAVVVRRGRLLGRYRKRHLIGSENDIFVPGTECPIFELGNLKFAINICYDMQFRACGTEAAEAGARLLVCPANNMLTRRTAEEWKLRHNEMRSEHARESGLWLLSSDVTGERAGRVSYGPTALIDPQGVVVQQLPLLETALLVVDIPSGSEGDRTAA